MSTLEEPGVLGSTAADADAPLQSHQPWVTVSKDEQGWWVQLEGSDQLDCYPTLTQAIHRGRKLAHRHKPSGLRIQHCDGQEEQHWFEPNTSP